MGFVLFLFIFLNVSHFGAPPVPPLQPALALAPALVPAPGPRSCASPGQGPGSGPGRALPLAPGLYGPWPGLQSESRPWARPGPGQGRGQIPGKLPLDSAVHLFRETSANPSSIELSWL